MSFPINPVHRLLLEDGVSYLLLEDNASKLILDETVALDDPLPAGTPGTTPAFTFAGESNNQGFLQKIADITTGAVTTQTITPLGNTRAGNTLILFFTAGSGGVVSSITDTQGNVWTIDVATAASARTAVIARAVMQWPLSTKDTITVNVSVSTGIQVVINEYQGVMIPKSLDKTSQAQGAAATTLATGSTGTLTEPQTLIFTGIGTAAGSGGFTPPGGIFTERLPTAGSGQVDIADAIVNSTNSVSATWSWVSAFNCGTAIAAYTLAGWLHYEIQVDTVNTFDSQ